MKNFLSTSLLGVTVAISGCHDPRETSDSVENLSSIHSISPEEARNATGIMHIQDNVVSNSKMLIRTCNYARVEYTPGEVYTVTAEHCIAHKGNSNYQRNQDLIMTKHIEETARRLLNNPYVTVRSRTAAPHVLPRSRYNENTIVGRTVTIVGCFSDSEKFWCYTIEGPVYGIGNERLLLLDESDFQRIFRNNTQSDREGLNGMSGSPVLDEHGGLVGTLARNYIPQGRKALGITMLADSGDNIKNIH